MPFIPVPGAVEVRLFGSLYGDTVINTFACDATFDPPSLSTMAPLANLIENVYETEFLPLLCEDFIHVRTELRDLSTQTGYVLQDSSGAGAGTLDGNGMPGNVTASIKFNTGVAGKSYRGGNHFSGLIEANVVGNNIGVDWLALVVAAYNTMFNNISATGDWTPVVVSRYTAGAPRASGITTPILNASYASAKVHTQRTRVNGR